MGFERMAAAALVAVALFASGIGAALAWRQGLEGSAAFAVLAAFVLAASLIGRLGRLPVDVLAGPVPTRTTEPSARWRAMLDHTPTPLVELRADGQLTAVNRAARGLFSTDERIVAPPEPLVSALAAGRPGERRALTLSSPDGPRAFSLSLAELALDDSASRLGALTDIQAEIHFAEAKALRDLLQVLSHEIMNSLTPVGSLAETAADYLRDETSPASIAAREALEVLGRRAGGLARFVEGYRALARLPSPTPRELDLVALLDDIARMFRARWASAGVALELNAPPSGVRLQFDPDLMAQALLNILANAAEAALEGAASPMVRLTAHHDRIIVADNGPGVPESERESVFAPFVTTKPNGTGVGLNLARQIARSHGGDLVLQARLGDWTEFVLLFR